MTINDLAKICHQANKAHCENNNDFSQVDWDSAPTWQKESIILGVKFQLANPDLPVSASHEAWCEHKIKEGWVYGELKDSEKKTHPCLVEHSMLPEHQKIKDYIIKSICAGLAEFITE
jgi:RyR domain